MDLAVRAFPHKQRERDGEMLRDLALEMIAGGKSSVRQALSLVAVGWMSRIKGFRNAPSPLLLREALVSLAGLLAPVLTIAVGTTFVVTAFSNYSLANNRLASGFSPDADWLIHAAFPWSSVLIGGVLASVGFSAGWRWAARLGSFGAALGALLVVGTMGGWLPGTGFAGPAELPFLTSQSYGFTPTAYVIAPIFAISCVMLLGSLLMPSGSRFPNWRPTFYRSSTPGLVGLAVTVLAVAISPSYLSLGTCFTIGWLIVLPIFGGYLRFDEATNHLSRLAVGVGLIVFSVPSYILITQMTAEVLALQDWMLGAIMFFLVPVSTFVGIAVSVSAFRRNRAAA